MEHIPRHILRKIAAYVIVGNNPIEICSDLELEEFGVRPQDVKEILSKFSDILADYIENL